MSPTGSPEPQRGRQRIEAPIGDQLGTGEGARSPARSPWPQRERQGIEAPILDGRNRYRACLDLGIEPRTIEWDGTGTVEAFVVSLNLHRRHLNESQRAMIAARISNLRHGQRADLAAKNEDAEIYASSISQRHAAKLLNVGRGTVQHAETVITAGTPEEIKAVEKGEIAASAVAKMIRDGKPAEERRDTVARPTDARGRRLPEKPLAERMARSLDQLETTIEVVAGLLARDDADGHPDIASWLSRLTKQRSTLSRAINLQRRGAAT